jgi:predicted aspartyl protease/Flp pilus assembly protein TadD
MALLIAPICYPLIAVSSATSPEAPAGIDQQKLPSHGTGEKAIREGQYQKAVKIFTDLLAQDPADTRATVGLSFAYLKLQNYVGCYDQARAVITADPGVARAYSLAGVALLRSGFLPDAVDYLIKALRINQREALAIGGLAEIDYYENRARDSYSKAAIAMALDPNEPDYIHIYARASSRLEMFSEAADAYERFLEVAPKTDTERRDRIRGLIQFYRKLTGLNLHQVSGQRNVEIPFALGSDRRPYMHIKVNGRPAKFVIDTGSGFTVISNDAAKRLRIKPIARGGTSQGVGGTGKFQIVYGLLNNLMLGEARVDYVPCFIRHFHTTKDRTEEDQADGFIGLSVLSNFLTELDYKSQVMRLNRINNSAQPDEPASEGVTVVPFRTTQNGLISVETQLDETHRINAILDSGASSTAVSTAAVERLHMKDKVIKGQTVQVIGAAGVSDNVELLFVRQCQVADLQQKNLRALILDFGAINETSGFEQSGILGGDFLRHFRLRINFNRAQLMFEPQTSAITRMAAPQKIDN